MSPEHITAQHQQAAFSQGFESIEQVPNEAGYISDISGLREGGKDPVLNATIRELIYQNSVFIVYLDENLRVQYRGQFAFPPGSEEVCFELSRLESLTLGDQSFFGIKQDKHQLLAMRRLIAEVFAKLHNAADLTPAKACLAKADQVISSVVADNTRLKRVVASAFITAVTGLIGWLWIFFHQGPGITPENEFALWIPLGAVGALLFSFTRMHSLEVKPFSSDWLVFWESTARILTGGIGALLLVAASKANLVLGAFADATSGDDSFWGMITLSILAGASERLVPDFISSMDGTSAPPSPASAPVPPPPAPPVEPAPEG
jgi:hypothetical protein